MVKKKENSSELLEAVMSRKIIHACLNLLSLYTNALANNSNCTFAEKVTVKKIGKFVDGILQNINTFALNKKGYEAVKVHSESMDTTTDFLIELLTLSEMLIDTPEARKKVLQRFEHLIGEENKRYMKNK